MTVSAICVAFYLQCICLIIELIQDQSKQLLETCITITNLLLSPDPMHSPKCLKCNEWSFCIWISELHYESRCKLSVKPLTALLLRSADEDVRLSVSLSPPQWCRNDALILSLGRRKAKPPPPPVWPSRAAIQWERNSTIHLHSTYLMKTMMIQLFVISTPLPAFLPIGLYIITHFKSRLLSVHTHIENLLYASCYPVWFSHELSSFTNHHLSPRLISFKRSQ